MITVKDILLNFPKNNTELIIPAFQAIQEEFHPLNYAIVYEAAQYFNISTEYLYSLLSFYPQFRFKPLGKYHIEICNSTLCKMSHHHEIASYLKKIIGIEPGEISTDALFSLDYGMCNSICKKHIRINNNTYLISSIEEINSIIDRHINEAKL